MLPHQSRVESPVGSSAVDRHTVLTIITPCFNAAATIGDTLLSTSLVAGLLKRRGWDLEHHVIDGGSTDGTLELIRSFQKAHPFCHLTSPVQGGPYVAMNDGLNHASGYFTHILNADDLIWNVSAYVELVVRSVECGASFVLGSIVYFRRPSWAVRSCWLVEPLPLDRGHWKRALRRGLHYPHPGFIARTNLYQQQGFDPLFKLSADYKLMQSLLIDADDAAVICTSQAPIVAMAEGGLTGRWQSIVSGYWQLRAINRQLGIDAPAWRRYLHKIINRFFRAEW